MACDECGGGRQWGRIVHSPDCQVVTGRTRRRGIARPDPRNVPPSKNRPYCNSTRLGGKKGHIHECRLYAGHRGRHACRSGDGETW